MSLETLLSLLGELVSFLLGKISREKGTIKAIKSYERKACRDYQKANRIRLQKSERATQSVLLEVGRCHSVDEVIRTFDRHGGKYPDGYVLRLAFIWDYYENINSA